MTKALLPKPLLRGCYRLINKANWNLFFWGGDVQFDLDYKFCLQPLLNKFK